MLGSLMTGVGIQVRGKLRGLDAAEPTDPFGDRGVLGASCGAGVYFSPVARGEYQALRDVLTLLQPRYRIGDLGLGNTQLLP